MPDTTGSECLRKGRGVMLDRNILKKLKCLNLYLETVASTEQQQQLKVGSGFVESHEQRGLTKDG